MSGFIHLGDASLIQMDEPAHCRRQTATQPEGLGALRERRANARVEVDEFHLAVRLGLLEDLPQVAAYRVLGNVQRLGDPGQWLPRQDKRADPCLRRGEFVLPREHARSRVVPSVATSD